MTWWIETINPADAEGVLKEAYDWQSARLGEPTEFTQLGSLYPELVLERLRLYKVVENTPSGLSPEERLLASLTTSTLNGTVHCASGAVVRLDELGVAARVVHRVEHAPSDPSTGSRRLDTILGYAAKLTRSPAEVSERDIEDLRDVGLSDLDILDLNNLVAYYNYVNRVANGLGLRTRIERREHALAAVPA
jgi:uncharacterized peroxidase-related enzyme